METYKAEVFENQEELNEFILKNEKIKIVKMVSNGDKRALFFEEPIKYYKYTPDYETPSADDYAGWNELMQRKGWFQGEWPY
jgi:hypothetical protein